MGRHSAPDGPNDFVNSRGEPRRRVPRHGEPGKPRAKKKAAAPVSATPVTAPAAPRPSRPSSPGGGRSERREVLQEQAERHATRAAIRSSQGGKPSVVGRAGAGAVAGAATGAAVGSVVPGIGTAVGGGVGAGVGAVGGGIGGARAKKAYRLATQTNGGARKVIVAEFAVCIVIAALSPLTDRRSKDSASAFMKRMTAIMGVFLVLALTSSMGRTPARLAAGLGGLITLALAVSERDLFTKVAKIFGSTKGNAEISGTGPGIEDLLEGVDIGTELGGTLGDVPVGG